ncbi:adenylate/guanylate cyclase domain-containing protein [Pedobacter aquatilis]|uniref:adenylate/guanylate cyclase domain-containing protein n=1 Tax=Pedobacter aquatilis TaxID=351343 RepID=UPI00292FA89C|nr:adenylate/guanylate cyclase domain-containing protein [Pedobacter aquatilis]
MTLLEKEVAKSEYQRARMVTILFIIGLDVIYFTIGLLESFNSLDFGIEFNGSLQIWFFSFLIYEVLVILFLRRLIKQERAAPNWFKYLNAFIEMTFISSLMSFIPGIDKRMHLIESPLFFMLYMVYLILSVLHINRNLIIFATIVAIGQYAIVTHLSYFSLAIPQNSYYLRCAVLLISGIAASYVAQQIRKLIDTKIQIQNEHEQLGILFSQQVSAEISAELTSNTHDGSQREITIMSLDIRNFTVFAERHSPEEIMAFQNKIFSPIIEIITEHKGLVNQILGDGIMASFGMRNDEGHALSALNAATKIIKLVSRMSSEKTIEKTKIGIGIHSGEVVVGNIGNEERKQYSISGSAVIIAFRIEQLNKLFHSDILITSAVKEKISIQQNVQYESVGHHKIKGFKNAIEVFKVIAG